MKGPWGDPQPCTGVLLAAGAGSRLGRGPKALLPYRDANTPGINQGPSGPRGDPAQDANGVPTRPLVVHVAQALHEGGCHRVVVVLGFGADEVAPAVSQHEVVVNSDWTSGMGSSFRAGVTAALDGHNADDDVMVALVDQPGISAAMVSRLLDEHGTSRHPGVRVTAAGYAPSSSSGGLVRGHPVILSADAARLAAARAEDDAGARAYLGANREIIELVDCSDLGDGRDIDVEGDLRLLG